MHLFYNVIYTTCTYQSSFIHFIMCQTADYTLVNKNMRYYDTVYKWQLSYCPVSGLKIVEYKD